MFNTGVIELIILLAFTYFIAGLMLSSFNEAIAAGFNTRGKDLKYILENMFKSQQWKSYISDQFYDSAHIQSLIIKSNRLPSYIPVDKFILTIMDYIKREDYHPEKIEKGIENADLPDDVKNVLLLIWTKSEAKADNTVNRMKAFENEIEAYYNTTMESASGWYKRKTRRILFFSGFLLAVVLNIDTIKISNDALSNKEKLSAAVNNIEKTLPQLEAMKTMAIADSPNNQKHTQITAVVNDTKKNISQLAAAYKATTGYYFGYTHGFVNEWGWGRNFKTLLLKLLGITLTAFALQLGSTYWFDVLNKFVNLRATGKKPGQ